MSKTITLPLDYYASPGPMTEPEKYSNLFENLPVEISELRRLVQGLIIHIFWAKRYGVELPEERQQETQLRHVAKMLKRIQELDDQPLTVERPLENRLVGNCRDFSTLLCTILRHHGVPARARCGFGTYFEPGWYEDHWVCEYWNANENRWILVDAQLDDFQYEDLKIEFDPCDLPRDQFLTGGKAWQLCRAEKADPDRFGIFDMYGLWFIRGNLVRDLASLNKIELLPWDSWGLIDKEDLNLSESDWALLDQAAALTLADNAAFSELRAIYDNENRLCVPPTVKSYLQTGVQMVDLTV